MKRKGIIFLFMLMLGLYAWAQQVVNPFQDGMVLAKNQPIYVYGQGHDKVVVSLNGKKAKAKQCGDRWIAKLPAMKAGGPYIMTIKEGESTRVMHDVYVGTVIMASGQSNMQFRLSASSTDLNGCKDDPLLRSFSLPRNEDGEPYKPEDGWVKCTRENVGNWSAVGYLVGREIRRRTGEAVGVVNCYQGASIIETWIPKEIVEKPEYILPKEALHVDHSYYERWNGAGGILYNLDIMPFAPYSVSEVVWYQGESNTGSGEAAIYPQLAKEMVMAWREAFQNKKLPFVMVQIADFDYRRDESWKALQECQLTIPSLVKNVKVVKSADVCESNDIHPRTKDKLALRIVDAIYGK